MLQITEVRPGAVVARLEHDDEILGEERIDVRLLPGRHWLMATPMNLSLEMLTSFVMPNDPVVAELLDEAAVLLEKRTGSPSMQGYQSGPERADAIAGSIYEAMQDRGIRYAEPPASWGAVGQKVRTPAEVLDGRVGTCLDTTVVSAAALEQVGLRPLIWVVDGHAFAGYWREELALDSIVHDEPSQIVNLIDLGHIRLVETTLTTKSEQPVPFEQAHQAAYGAQLTGGLDNVLGVVDVWTARRNDILPLPVRRQTEAGVQVIEYRAAVHTSRDPAPKTEASSSSPGPTRATVPPRVQHWKNALLDMTLRNRLINYSDRGGVRLCVPLGRLAEIEDLVNDRKQLLLRPADQIDGIHRERGVRSGWDLPQPLLGQHLDQRALFTDVTLAGYETRMRGLAYKARTIAEETGANNLYLALGSLIWDVEGKPLRSPLVLVPVRLSTTARGGSYRLELDESGTSTPNYCLLEKLRQLHNLDVPGLAEPAQDDSGIDLDQALNAMRSAIRDRGLSYRVEPTADLSILQFAKFRLWKDLDDHWEELVGNSLVRHLVENPTDPYDDPVPPSEEPVDLDALEASCPIPADASQLEAVAEAVAGHTFVLEGPPGTGKSQTITNLLTRAVAEGKRVLFVAEKRAALDVVAARLESVGMGPFALDLHDKGSKPTVVRAQIKAAMEHAVAVDAQGLAAAEEDLRSSRRTLARYAERLHEPNGASLSYYSARTGLLANADAPDLPIPRHLLTAGEAATVADLTHRLKNLADVADLARPSVNHPWGFVGLTEVSSEQAEAVRRAAQDVDALLPRLPRSGLLAEAVNAARTFQDVVALNGLLGTPVPLDVLDQTGSDSWQHARASLTAEISAFVAAAHPGLDVATPAALDLPLADIHAKAQAAAASGFFGRKKRLRAVLELLQPALREGAEVPPKKVPELTSALLQVQGAVRGLASRATGVPGVDVPGGWNPFTEEGQRLVDRQVAWLDWAGAAVRAPETEGPQPPFVASLRAFLRQGDAVDPEVRQVVQRLSEALTALGQLTQADSTTTARWSGDVGVVGRWEAGSGRRDLTDSQLHSLRRWVDLTAAVQPLRQAGLVEAADLLVTGRVDADHAGKAFTRGLARASLEERCQATGLDGFDPLGHDRTVQRFTRSAQQVREHMVTAVPDAVLRARPFQASTGRGQVGELLHELSKQRRGLGVRALLDRYGSLITQVMPCVLVSPDSVARFFPVGSQTFDLVVFDEASQIRVADAIGAMGRAGSVVVVGDSKQMPPTTFGESSGDADMDSGPSQQHTVEEDQESILTEAVNARVPRRWLSWHYRSQDESLIAFSNSHYYESKLSSFPAPTHADADRLADGHGVSLVRVDGTFQRSGKGKLLRTNPVEAEAIFAEIRRRFDASPDHDPSLGVITFNQQQRALIEAMIRDSQDERLVNALDGTNGEGLFVKNLENVQGDERDMILFSTAFSVNGKGVLPLNFGPLTRGGGERRLNVAVTRARRQVVIYSSFDPAQLRVEETQSVGIKHLRAYLELAARGAAALAGPTGTSKGGDLHAQEVARRLRERGLAVTTDVGLSDFRIDLTLASGEQPERPVVAVLLDGPGWAARRTVGDRDGLPVVVLSRLMGWPAVERVWMPAWMADPDAVVEHLVQVVHEAARRDLEPVRQAPPAPVRVERAPEPEALVPLRAVSAPTAPAALPGQKAFAAWQPSARGGREVLDGLTQAWAADRVQRVIAEVVHQEGPVHDERLARLVAAAFDLTRLNAARIAAITAQVSPTFRRDPDEPFAWPGAVDPSAWTAFRTHDTAVRPLEHISLREIGNAMVALCRDAAGMTADELDVETLALFGGRRRTPGIAARLTAAREVALARGRLRQSGSGLLEAI